MADVPAESRQEKLGIGSKSKHDEYMERFHQFKKAKQMQQPLQERRKSTNNNVQKRKSCPDATSKVPFKKSKENTGVLGSLSRSKPNPCKTNTAKKPANSQQSTQKQEPRVSTIVDTETEHPETPMLVRLQRWKEEKQKRIQESKKENRKSCTGLTASYKKQIKPVGPRPSQQSQNRQTSRTSDKTPTSTEGSMSKWERLSRGKGSIIKPKDGVLSQAMSNSRNNMARKGSVTGMLGPGSTARPSGSHDTVTKSQTNSRSQTTTQKVKPKRRHSEVQARLSPLRRRGILKRKSCIADFGGNQETESCDRVPTKDKTSAPSPTDNKTGQTTIRVCKTPDTARTVRFSSPQHQTNDTMFRKTPSKHGPKEESMRHKLNDWLVAKGKTPSKFRHLVCFDAKMSERKKRDPKMLRSLTVEELTVQQETMDRETPVAVNLKGAFDKVAEEEEIGAGDGQTQEDSDLSQLRTILDECTILFEAGCPQTDILKWLDSIEQNIPLAKKSAIFYICKAQVLQCTADLDSVLKVFEQAVINAAQPAQELASALTTIVKDITKERERKARQKGVEKRLQEENIFESSTIKYCVRQVTPFKKRSRKSTGDISTPQCNVLTPVRRSTRRSLASLPDNLQEKTPVFNTLEELSKDDQKKTLFKENTALTPLYSEEGVLEKFTLDFNDSSDVLV